MKSFICAICCVFAFSIFGKSQCPPNSDRLYDRDKLLQKFEDILQVSNPSYRQSFMNGFFVYDLTEPSNKFVKTKFAKAETCINFIDDHVYHLSAVEFEESFSNIIVLENGSFKAFKSVNCLNGGNTLSEVFKYTEKKLKTNDSKEILTRLKNYRRYGIYLTTDGYRVSCNYDKVIPENSDKLYNRNDILRQFADVLRSSVSEKVEEQLTWRFFIEEERANGFFVWDLTEPTNKQSSLLERVEFKNNHVYHFAFIDSPFSFSNIAVLEDGKLKIFENINCSGKGDSLQDVIGYLNQKPKTAKNKKEILKRIKNYRKYGVYASFNGFSTPQCEEVVKTAEK